MEQDLELVLLRYGKLFLVWREHYLLLQGAYPLCGLLFVPSHLLIVACRLCRRELPPVRSKPQDHQLYTLHDWLRGFCHVTEEGSPQTAIRSILLGPYVTSTHCRL